MKFKLMIFFLAFSGVSVAQQNTFPGTGNVGIGTGSPAEALEVNGNVKWNGFNSGNLRALKIGYSGGNYGGIGYNIDFTNTSGIFNRPLADRSSYLEFTAGGFNFYGGNNSNSASNVGLGQGDGQLSLFATLNAAGNLGVGTATPANKLSVLGNISSTIHSNEGGAIFLENSMKTGTDVAYRWAIYNMTGPYGNSLQFWNYSQDVGFYGSKLTLLDNGNMGIGTSTPRYKLEVNGDVALPHTGKILSSSDGGNHITLHNGNGLMKLATGGQDRMVIEYTGNVGIGTSVPTEKLSVKGKVRAQEVKVEASNWPDYVFEKGYQVETLKALESYIKVNKRLPEMPTAKEVETNGIELGMMNKLLLKKQEELTLLLIDQNKQLIKLTKMMSKQQQEFNKLKSSKKK